MILASEEWKQLVRDGAEEMGIPLRMDQVDQLAQHCEMLVFWNRKTNLTAITDPAEIAVKHVLDSLAAVNIIPAGSTVLDMGSGGGFPGIPIKIASPSLSMTLMEASAKKVTFLKHVIRTLGLIDCTAVSGRVEQLAAAHEFSGRFQSVVCRSFAPLHQLLVWGLPFLSEDGRIIALKGDHVEAEIEEFQSKNKSTPFPGTLEVVYYDLPTIDIRRSMVLVTAHPLG